MSPSIRPVPRATYRLQFSADFRFRDAARLVPYIARLGVSHVYASPLTAARPGSGHGYDVIDHGRLDPALGSLEDFASFVCALRASRLALVLDVVPNHTGIGPHNPFWQDVLEWGRASPFADWFDIDWQPEAPGLAGRVLVPVLDDQIGVVLARGGIGLIFDAQSATIAVEAPGGQRLPLRPEDTATVLAPSQESDVRLERIADGFAGLPDAAAARRDRVVDLRRRLSRLVEEDSRIAATIERALARYRGRPDDAQSWRTLGALLDRQHWRLAHFQVASDDINYRRFFNINDLAGLRVEKPEVFDHVHKLAFDLVDEGIVEGLRIDHVDGLIDPAAYCNRLRAASPRPVWLVVEKILAADETLPDDWDVDGTTGYDVAALLTGLLVDPDGLARLSALHERVDRRSARFPDITRESRLLILDEELASELNRLGRMAAAIAASNPVTADHTRSALTRGLRAVIAAFPVYRTYVVGDSVSGADRRALDAAFAAARRRSLGLDPSVFDLLYDLMTTDAVARAGSGFSPQAVIRFAMRVQQVTGPVMAKGVEDTALYRFHRLLALNEVGSDPDGDGIGIDAFHARAVQLRRRTPATMLSTSTHDTKRGEDARARLAALCVLSEDWEAHLLDWLAEVDATAGSAVGASEALMILQQLTGSVPPHLEIGDGRTLESFRERLQASIRKSLREAKLSTGWSRPDDTYEAAVAAVVDRALDPSPDGFLARFMPFHHRVDALGRRFGLLQTALKLTLPGVPDIYQGAELEDFSMVDPDNRRPVDFPMREALLAEVEEGRIRDVADRRDGAGKIALIARLLGLRRRLPDLFAAGSYEPISDPKTGRLVAFLRRHADTALVVVAVRFTGPPIHGTLALPASAGRWTDVLSGEPVSAGDGIDLAALDGPLPVAVLLAEPTRQEEWT